jgi:hypothetical protein
LNILSKIGKYFLETVAVRNDSLQNYTLSIRFLKENIMDKKNQKIADLKKLAKLGLTAGLLMSSQALVAGSAQLNGVNYEQHLAGGACGAQSGGYSGYSTGSCAAQGNAQQYYQHAGCAQQSAGYAADAQQWHAQSGCAAHQQQAQQYYQHAGCAAQGQQWHSQSGCAAHQQQAQQYYQSQGSCASHAGQWQAQSGCASHQPQAQQGYQAHAGCAAHQQAQSNYQAQSGCAHKQNQQTQWATAIDNTDDQNINKGTQPNAGTTRPNYTVAEAETTLTKAAPLTEKDLMDNVNAQSKAIYQSLSPEGKALALKLANQDCKGKNDCKGQNSCKTAKNDCAGKGGCKGQSPANFKDKNQAIKVASLKMAEKRNSALNK